MLKRLLAIGLATILFSFEIVSTANAQEISNISAHESVNSDEADDHKTEVTTVSGNIADSDVSEDEIPSEESTTELENDEISIETAAGDIVYTLTYETPIDNMLNEIKLSIRIDGYENISDYWSELVYLQVSETSDFSVMKYGREYLNFSEDSTSYACSLISSKSFVGKENMTYYIRLVKEVYNLEAGKYEDAPISGQDPLIITTGDYKQVNIELTPDRIGAAYASINYTISGIAISDLSGYLFRYQISKDSSFDTIAQQSSIYMPNSEEDAEEITGSSSISYLEPETEYYIRLVMYNYDNYSEYRLLGDVITITTAANEIYSESNFDSALLEIIKKQLPYYATTLDRKTLESITSLSGSKNNTSDNTVQSLKGIELLSNLEYLYLNYHNISDLSPLSELTALKYVSLNYNKIETICDLSKLVNLTSLGIGGNYIPSGEFVSTNTNIPAYFRNLSYWLTSTSSSQRIGKETTIITSDTYYMNGSGYPLQVELTNYFPLGTYSLSVYKGDDLILEKLDTTYNYSYSSILGWVIDDFITTEGTQNYTFVVYQDDTEIARLPKDITFLNNPSYFPNGKNYLTPNSSYISDYFYLYGLEDAVETVHISGNSNTYMSSVSSNLTTSNLDQRYNGIFSHPQIRSNYVYTYFSMNLTKYLPIGEYDLIVTLTNGEQLTLPGQIVVTGEPRVSSINTSYSNYNNSENNQNIYISVNGYNMDWDKMYPVVYNGDGSAITKVIEYKITSTSNAVYKLQKIVEDEWSRSMMIKMQNNSSSTLINQEKVSTSLSLHSDPNAYYIEHIPDNDTVRVMTENIPEGQEIIWELRQSYYGDTVAACTAGVHNDMVILEFKNSDGTFYEFDTEQSSYYLYAVITKGTINYTISSNFTNYNYEYQHNDATYTNINYSRYFINSGQIFTSTFTLEDEIIPDQAVLKAYIKDADGNIIIDNAELTPEKITISGNTKTRPGWSLTVSFPEAQFTNDTIYYLEITVNESSLGQATVYVLDSTKQYISYSGGSSLQEASQILRIWTYGYFHDLDTSKLKMRILDAAKETVFEPAIKNAVLYKSTNLTYQELELDIDISKIYDTILDYTSLYYELLYDGVPISSTNLYGNTSNSLYISTTNSYVSFLSRGDNYKYSYNGLYISSEEKSFTVYIYLPYDTKALKRFTITADSIAYNNYTFKSSDLGGLSYNAFTTRYYILVVDSNGKYLNSTTGYLAAEEYFPFSDITTDPSSGNYWIYPAVQYVFNRGIMTGKSTTNFDPVGLLTRAEFATTLYSMEGKPAVEYSNTFKDVPNSTWYTNPVLWAYNNGITSGYGTTFGVSDNITREQLALMVYKYAASCDYDLAIGDNVLDKYHDTDKVSSWALTAVQWAVTKGVISGTGAGYLNPGGYATRAECAAILRTFSTNFIESN